MKINYDINIPCGISFGVGHASGLDFNNSRNMNINQYSEPKLIETIVKDDCIELVYTETKLWSFVNGTIDKRVFKVIYSCKEGKWNKSEKIYGQIIPASEERYEF